MAAGCSHSSCPAPSRPTCAGTAVTLHSFPCEDNEDAFYCTGRATVVDDPVVRQALADVFVTERADAGVPVPAPDHQLFRFGIETCLLTRTTGHGDFAPQHTTWRDPAA